MIVSINLRWQDRAVDFKLDLNETCPMEHAVLHYVKQGVPCEPETVFVMLRALHEGDFAVDAGANIGFFTVLMSKLVGKTGLVLAFEPGGNNLPKLRRNLELNNCRNVKVVEEPLWSLKAAKDLYVYEDGGANSLWPIHAADRPSKITTTTLDLECDKCPSDPTLIKLDIEGAELRALRGAWDVLCSRPIIITEMNEQALERAGTAFAEVRKQLPGYECFGLSETGHFPVYIPRAVPMKAVKYNTNVMFATLEQVQRLWPEAVI